MALDDNKLREVMQVDTPPALEARLRQIPQMSHSRFPVYGWVSMAASVALVAVLYFRPGIAQYDRLHTYAFAHHYHEAEHIADVREPISSANVSQLLARFDLTGEVDFPVVFAETCHFGGITALHLVLQTDAGDVTAFYVPEAFSDATEQFTDGVLQGYSRGFNGGHLVTLALSSVAEDVLGGLAQSWSKKV